MTLSEALGLDDPVDAEALSRHFDLLELPAGRPLFKRNEPSNALYLLLSGQVSVNLQQAGSDYTKRLRSYGPGTIVGEMGFYSHAPRSADVVADMPTRAARLDFEQLKSLELHRPDLAAQLHRFVINTLAARLRTANQELSQML
jgi:SulP family sulfate permease